MEQKKPTKAQIENRIKNAVLHIDKTKDTKSIYFSDKGLRLVVNEDFAIVETGYHRHVFSRITSSGVSRPYLYVEQFIDIALNNDCKVKDAKGNDAYSYTKLFEVTKDKETEYNILWYADKWMFNIFQPLYSIGESEAELFLVYESYLHAIARNALILGEHKEKMTNKQFIDGVVKNLKDYTENIEERVLFDAKSDGEMIQEEIDALQEQESNEVLLNSKE